MQEIFHHIVRLKKFYRMEGNSDSRVHLNFVEFWRDIMPAPFSKDEKLARRMGDLLKFKRLTYRVANVSAPFESMDRKPSLPGMKRSMQK